MALPLVASLLIVFEILVCNVNANQDTELVLLHIIFRHGARTTYATYPNDPYQNETYYPYGWGSLTNRGKLEEYQLGKFLRNQYSGFLGEDYHDDKLYVRSTDTLRTKSSALLVLAGLFPPSQKLTWNSNLRWLPIPVSYRKDYNEDIFHTRVCAYKNKVFNELLNNRDVQDRFIIPYREFFDKIESFTRKSIKHPVDLQDLYFVLITQRDLNYTLPEWTKDVFPEPMETISALTYEYLNYNLEARKMNMGYLLKTILARCEDRIEQTLLPPDRKLFLYSGHETTLGFMINALFNFSLPKIPPYSSALSFELHKSSSSEDYFIKIRFRNTTYATEFSDLEIPNCGVLCPIEKFKEIFEYLIPTLTIQDACKIDRYNTEHNVRMGRNYEL